MQTMSPRVLRRDIEGLRAIAVISVVAYHAGAPGFVGGFTGVDVFFVISGFLITQMLCREVHATGNINIVGFYARRVRRLLPAAVLVAMATFVVSRLFLPPMALLDLRWDAISSVANVSNYWLAFRNTQYLGGHSSASSYQQYWSLAVEEQFYIVWPLLISLVASVAGGKRFPSAIRFSIATVMGLSFIACIVVTITEQPWAFFSLPTRAWELAIGGMAAVTLGHRHVYRKRLDQFAGYAGIVIIGLSIFLIDGAVGFPGWIAAFPTLGALLVVGSGFNGRDRILDAFLCNRLLTWIGKVSYSLYLWHWPIFVIAAAVKGSALVWRDYAIAIPLSLVAAWFTCRYVEFPLRHARWLSAQPSRSLSAGVLTSACAAGLVLILAIPPILHTNDTAAVPKLLPTGLEPVTPFVPINLKPDLLSAGDHFPVVFADGCHDGFRDVVVHPCVYGSAASKRVVVLFGDSHAAQWFPALQRIADQDSLRLISLTKSGCPSAIVRKESTYLGRRYTECDVWREAAFKRIDREHPSLVIMANSTNATDDPTRIPDGEWIAGMGGTLRRLSHVPHVTVMVDTPYSHTDVPTCLSAHLDSALGCAIPRATALDETTTSAQAAVVRRYGRQNLDLNSYLCTGSVCPTIFGNILVYLDKHHLSPDVTVALSPVMQRYIARSLGLRGLRT